MLTDPLVAELEALWKTAAVEIKQMNLRRKKQLKIKIKNMPDYVALASWQQQYLPVKLGIIILLTNTNIMFVQARNYHAFLLHFKSVNIIEKYD